MFSKPRFGTLQSEGHIQDQICFAINATLADQSLTLTKIDLSRSHDFK